MTCYVFSVGRSDANIKPNPSTDFYEFNCGKLVYTESLCFLFPFVYQSAIVWNRKKLRL